MRTLAAMRGKSCLRPVAERAFCGAGDKLLSAFGDETHHLSARFVVEAARCEDLRDLFAELAVTLESFLDVLANDGGQSCL